MQEKYFDQLEFVERVVNLSIRDRIIEELEFDSGAFGSLLLGNLGPNDAGSLYNFYFEGLSEQSRIFFPPYPLFSPRLESDTDLRDRIIEWKKEKDWVFFLLKGNSQIMGVSLLKRMSTDRPTSGIAVNREYTKAGVGFFLQKAVEIQARLLSIKSIYVTLAQDNVASLKLHQKCGFIETENLVPHYGYKNGVKFVDRYDKEMMLKINENFDK